MIKVIGLSGVAILILIMSLSLPAAVYLYVLGFYDCISLGWSIIKLSFHWDFHSIRGLFDFHALDWVAILVFMMAPFEVKKYCSK